MPYQFKYDRKSRETIRKAGEYDAMREFYIVLEAKTQEQEHEITRLRNELAGARMQIGRLQKRKEA